MRQAGYLAAAGIYALDNHVQRLKEDNNRAKQIAQVLQTLHYVSNVRPVQTNILIFDVNSPYTAATYLEKLLQHDIKATAFGPQTIRFVTHLDFTEEMLEKVLKVIGDW